jgi:hypothetical protein
MSATASAQETERLRRERNLRELKSEEEGTDVFKLPDGLYGFTYSAGQNEMPIFSKNPYSSFEIHRLATGEVHILGFVTPAEKAQIQARERIELQVFPQPFGDATAMVSLDMKLITPAKKGLPRTDGNPFKTTVYPE